MTTEHMLTTPVENVHRFTWISPYHCLDVVNANSLVYDTTTSTWSETTKVLISQPPHVRVHSPGQIMHSTSMKFGYIISLHTFNTTQWFFWVHFGLFQNTGTGSCAGWSNLSISVYITPCLVSLHSHVV